MRNVIIILLLSLCLISQGQIAPDKKLHGAMGGYAAFMGSTFHMPQDELVIPAIKGLSVAFVVGGSKELFDMAVGGTPEWGDLGATMLGAVAVTGGIIGVKTIIKRRRRNKKFNNLIVFSR